MKRKVRIASILTALTLLAVGITPEYVMAETDVYKVSQRNEYWHEGGPQKSSEPYEYDKDGNMVKSLYIIYPDPYPDFEELRDPGRKTVSYCSYEDGRLIRSISYTLEDDGSEVNPSTTTCEYNDEGQLTQEKHVSSSGASSQTKNQYSDGKLVRKVDSSYKDGVLVSRFIYKYSYGKNSETSKTYDKNHNPESKAVYIFDKNGNKIQSKTYTYKNGKWSIFSTRKYAYDSKNRQVKYESYKANGKIEERELTTYDGKNRQVKYESYKANGKIKEKKLTTYDNKKRQTTYKTYGASGKLKEKEVYTKNKYGDCVKYVYCRYDEFGTHKTVKRYSYEYDSHGNITKYVRAPEYGKPDCITYEYVKIGD